MQKLKYIKQARYLLRLEQDEKEAYEAAAVAAHLSLADWINAQLRRSLKLLTKENDHEYRQNS